MARFLVPLAVLLALVVAQRSGAAPPSDLSQAGDAERATAPTASERLERYVRQREAEFDQIPDDRKATLRKLARHVEQLHAGQQAARLLFICTHNSRRSQLAQIWAAAAAAHYGVEGVDTYSGGTESTAFNPRAVAALERAGFEIARENAAAANPHYQVRYSPVAEPLVCFSKTFAEPPNPREDFCAVLTCSEAERACPIVPGATLRVALPYGDPKASDGMPGENAAYDERCAQIARELLYVFSLVAGTRS